MINIKYLTYLILILGFFFYTFPKRCKNTPVYCLMITGHLKERREFALKSITNFLTQSYDNKHLIILNQDDISLLKHDYDNILEVKIDNKNKSLGELRNISLQLVPPISIWTVWDDDDYRVNNYISTMVYRMLKTNSDFLMFQNRIEYNLNNDFTFKMTLKSGFMTFFAKHNPYLQYEHISTSEDKKMKQYALKHLKVHVFNNNPLFYIRAIHTNNTSVYVSQNKNKLQNTINNKVYFENNLSKYEKEQVNNIIYKYYK